MRFILCEKQFLHLNTDADAVNAEMSMPRYPSGQHGLLHNSFFQHDSELNKTMKTCHANNLNKIIFSSGKMMIRVFSIPEVLI